MKILVTGGAGFIGCHLVRALLAQGHEVRVMDRARPLEEGPIPKVYYWGRIPWSCDMSALDGVDLVYHLAANTDLRESLTDPTRDFESAQATSALLEAMRAHGVRDIVFASSATVYGMDRSDSGPPERTELSPTVPISLYGASKLYGEGMIRAYCEAFGFRAVVMRFGNVVGKERRTGVIWDFLTKLCDTGAVAREPRIDVLGDGNQRKTYIHVDDCVGGLLHAIRIMRVVLPTDSEVFNLATPGTVRVREIARAVRAASPYPNAEIAFGVGAQGWKGDVPICELSSAKLARWGFGARLTGMEAVERVIKEQAVEIFGAGVGTSVGTTDEFLGEPRDIAGAVRSWHSAEGDSEV